MKKIITKIALGTLLCVGALQICAKTEKRAQAEMKPEYLQDVPLDQAHFPDEQLRTKLKYFIDTNKDGILSRQERENIYYLSLYSSYNGVTKTWYPDIDYSAQPKYSGDSYTVRDETKRTLSLNFNVNDENPQHALADRNVDLTGIEYFFNLQEVKANKCELLKGSFKNNANLRKIWIRCSKLGDKNYDTIQTDFPVSQLTYMHLENVNAGTLDTKQIPNLEILRVILPDESNSRLKALDLSKNLMLKELTLTNIMPGKLDLRKNQKLETVKVSSGKSKKGQLYEWASDNYGIKKTYLPFIYYAPKKNQTCKITFAKKNQIKTFYYFTGDKDVDITNLSKLEDFQTLKTVNAKVRSSWIRKTFKKSKWGCTVVKNGKFIKKITADKKKKFTKI